MATVVYQSYFESQRFEPRALRLRLSSLTNPLLSTTPLKSDSSTTPQDNTTTTNAASLSSSGPNQGSNSGSWSFLESLSNSKSNDEDKKTVSVFQPPSSSRRTLSDQSLALCTESLGSETGSDIINGDEDLFSISSESKTMETRTTSSTTSGHIRKRKVMASLPPPLTSIRGLDSIELKSHRQNGRLVMTATKPPARNRCLQDRSNGCVRLAILIDGNNHIETETIEQEEEDTIETVRDNEEEIPEYVEEEEEEEEEVKGVEKIQRSRRCIEGDRENRVNLESFCVATL